MLPFENFTFGDDHERAKDTVHLPWASTHAVAETAAQIVSPADEGTLGPLLKFSWSNFPSFYIGYLYVSLIYKQHSKYIENKRSYTTTDNSEQKHL